MCEKRARQMHEDALGNPCCSVEKRSLHHAGNGKEMFCVKKMWRMPVSGRFVYRAIKEKTEDGRNIAEEVLKIRKNHRHERSILL